MIVIETAEGDRQRIFESQLERYPGATVIAKDVDVPDELAVTNEKGIAEIPLAVAEEAARAQVAEAADALAKEAVPEGERRAQALLQLWNECQMVKLLVDIGKVPGDPIEQVRRVPFLGALAQQTGIPLAEVWQATQSRIEERVWKLANAEVTLVLANEAISNAATAEEKLDVVRTTDWSVS